MKFRDLHHCKVWPYSRYADYEVDHVAVTESDSRNPPVRLKIFTHKANILYDAMLYMDRGVIWIGGEQVA